jgi:drug/metabolite transporter (DMT)-like permease
MPSAIALLALAQVAIGAAAIFARFALAGGGPVAISAARLGIATLPVALTALGCGAYRRYDRLTEGRLGLAGIALALHFACWIASLRYASVAVSTLLVSTTPIWTEAFAVARSGRVRGDLFASVGLTLGGAAIVIGVPDRGQAPLGIGLALAGALAFAAYLLLVRASDSRYGTLAIVARTYPVATLALTLAACALRDPLPPPAQLGAWGGIVGMALVSQLFGHTALNAAVRRLSATLVATATMIEPAIAAILAALILGERLAPGTLVGAAVVLSGIAVALRAEYRTSSRGLGNLDRPAEEAVR